MLQYCLFVSGVDRVCDVREWLVWCGVVHCVFRIVEWRSVYGVVCVDENGEECVGIVVVVKGLFDGADLILVGCGVFVRAE